MPDEQTLETEQTVETEPTVEPAPSGSETDQLLDELLGPNEAAAGPEPETPSAPPPGNEPDPRVNPGMLRDLQGERSRRQAAEAERDQLLAMQAELAEIKATLAERGGNGQPPADPLADLGDDDFVNAAAVRAAVQHVRQSITAEQTQQAREQQLQQQRFAQEADDSGRDLYPDFQTVVERGQTQLSSEDVAFIRTARTPAGAAKRCYDLCRERASSAPAAARAPVNRGGFNATPPPASTRRPGLTKEQALEELVDIIQSTDDEKTLNQVLGRVGGPG